MKKFLTEMRHRAGLLEGPDNSDDGRLYVIEHHVSNSRPFVEEAADWKAGDAVQALLDGRPLEDGQYIVIRLAGPDEI